MGSALLLVDIQNDFCSEGALPVKHGESVVRIANILAPQFPLVVASQDWHPANHASFAVNVGRAEYSSFELEGLLQTVWPVHCVRGTRGAELHPSLTDRIHAIFRKGMDPWVDSYSAFYDNDRRSDTGLAGFLRGKAVTSLFIMGLATEFCVKSSALDAVGLGFDVTVITDGCRGVNAVTRDDEGLALIELERSGVTLKLSKDVSKF
jgi:nicotinamidase/pyrazinamidase